MFNFVYADVNVDNNIDKHKEDDNCIYIDSNDDNINDDDKDDEQNINNSNDYNHYYWKT